MDNEELNNQNLSEELNEEEENNIVTLKDEDGNDIQFEFLDFIEYNDDNFVVLLPLDEDSEDSDEVVILKEDKDAETDDEDEAYVTVDDEEVLNEVFEIFKEKFKDEFDFDEE